MNKKEVVAKLHALEDVTSGILQKLHDHTAEDYDSTEVSVQLEHIKRDIYDLWNGLEDGEV